MPRRSYKRLHATQDALYKSYEVSKLINYLMEDGKKAVAQKIVYETLDKLKEVDADPVNALLRAITNVTPAMEVRPRRLGGASYMVPIEVRKTRKLFLALNWIIQGAQSRSNKEFRTFADKLFAEIKDAVNSTGTAYNKKLSVEKQAEQNKAFAHLKW